MLELGDFDKTRRRMCRYILVAKDLTAVRIPVRTLMVAVQLAATLCTSHACVVESLIVVPETFVVNRVFAYWANIRRVADVVCGIARLRLLFSLQLAFERVDGVEKLLKTIFCPNIALVLEGTLKADADQKLQVVRQRCDQGQQVLRNTQSTHAGVL